MWPKTGELEGSLEIYLRWPVLARLTLMMLVPLFAALFFDSLIISGACWALALLAYIGFLRVWGPCVMAVAVGGLPLYVFLEWNSAPVWLAYLAAVIALIEISYIRHRMRFIDAMREKEEIPD